MANFNSIISKCNRIQRHAHFVTNNWNVRGGTLSHSHTHTHKHQISDCGRNAIISIICCALYILCCIYSIHRRYTVHTYPSLDTCLRRANRRQKNKFGRDKWLFVSKSANITLPFITDTVVPLSTSRIFQIRLIRKMWWYLSEFFFVSLLRSFARSLVRWYYVRFCRGTFLEPFVLYTNTNEREEYKKCEIILGRDSVLVFVCVDVITHFFRESPILAIYASLVERVCTRLVIGSFQVRTFSWCVHLVSFFSLLSFEFALLLRHSIPPPHYHHYHHHPTSTTS